MNRIRRFSVVMTGWISDKKITEDAVGKINRGGYIFYEIGYDEAEDVSNILRQNGFEDINVIKDLGGLDRVVSARKGDFDV